MEIVPKSRSVLRIIDKLAPSSSQIMRARVWPAQTASSSLPPQCLPTLKFQNYNLQTASMVASGTASGAVHGTLSLCDKARLKGSLF